MRFPDYQNGSAFLERTLGAPSPAWATIPGRPCWPNTRNNLVITTNFDSP